MQWEEIHFKLSQQMFSTIVVPPHTEVYSIHHFAIMFVNNIESGVKHHNPQTIFIAFYHLLTRGINML